MEDKHRADTLKIGALCNDTVLTVSEDGTPSTAATPPRPLRGPGLHRGLDKNKLELEMPRRSEIPLIPSAS